MEANAAHSGASSTEKGKKSKAPMSISSAQHKDKNKGKAKRHFTIDNLYFRGASGRLWRLTLFGMPLKRVDNLRGHLCTV